MPPDAEGIQWTEGDAFIPSTAAVVNRHCSNNSRKVIDAGLTDAPTVNRTGSDILLIFTSSERDDY